MTALRKRFIAGAKCPQCHLEDRIVLYREAEISWIECVACGLKQKEPGQSKKDTAPKKEVAVKWPIRHKID